MVMSQAQQGLALLFRTLILLLALIGFKSAFANDSGMPFIEKKLKMQVYGKFEAGQPEVTIYKLFDASDDVICYALMPDHVTNHKSESGTTYEGNSIGSISCLKNRQLVIPIQTQPTVSPNQTKK